MAEELTLYALEDELAARVETLDCADPAQEMELIQSIEEYTIRAVEKRDRMAQFLRHLEAQEQFAKDERTRLEAREQYLRNTRKRLEAYVMCIMDAHEVKKLEGRTSTLCLRPNPPSVEIDDALAIPAEFVQVKTERVPLKNNIKAALKAGREVPGARLRDGSQRLEIR